MGMNASDKTHLNFEPALAETMFNSDQNGVKRQKILFLHDESL